MSYRLQVDMTFESQAAAQDAYDQMRSRAVNAGVARIGEPGERTSHSLVVDEADGSIIARWHTDRFGIVRDGALIPDDEIPAWIQPGGSQDAYPLMDVWGNPAQVVHNAKVWQNNTAANVWEPPTSWDEVGDA